jgi:hydroxyethylthiazole kinase-like uncharacterized protein yjeF
MKYLSSEQMREADRRCIEDIGIPGAVLMSNAGRAVFQELEEGPVGIVCGRGNNGGDGFVVAYHALLEGLEPRLVLLADPHEITGDAATFMHIYQNLGGAITAAPEAEEAARAVAGLTGCAVLIDAMLGTGAKGPVRDPYKSAIAAWPDAFTVAVDVPSGLDADMGEPGEVCIRAYVTVTMQYPKKGFHNDAAKPFLGRLVVADIGIPAICADDAAWEHR